MSKEPEGNVREDAAVSQGVGEERGLYNLGYQNGLLRAAGMVLEARLAGGNGLSVANEILQEAEQVR